MKVYVLDGWFGDAEWREGIYLNQADAQARCDELWLYRTSEHAPDWCQRFCKFAVEEVEVIE